MLTRVSISPNFLKNARKALAVGLLLGINAVVGLSPAFAFETDRISTIPEGVYLFGEATAPDIPNQNYFVFEAREGKVVGAAYAPRSSFDCFYGVPQEGRLAIVAIETYTQQPYSHAIAFDRDRATFVASNNGSVSPALGFEGYHRLSEVSDNDRRMLDVCKAEYGDRVWE